MNKKNIGTFNKPRPLFSALKSFSVDEILAAGGTTAFANKMGKSAAGLEEALKKLPKEALLTEEEFSAAMKTLNESK